MADIEAHITGTVWKIEVKVGDDVADGDTVVILESMKMEMPVESEDDGKVAEISARKGSRSPKATCWLSSSSEELASGKVRLDRPADAVARLTITRPDARNALDHDVLGAIAEAMPGLDDGIETRCVILTGEGKAF